MRETFPAPVKPKPGEFPTSIRLSRQLKADLLRYAKLDGFSLTALITEILGKWAAWRKEQDRLRAGKHKK
jgi:hypothetical protein